MKRIILTIFLGFMFLQFANAEVISGKINHDDMNYQNRIIDSKTKKSIDNAKITIPEYNYTTYSNADGSFKLNADIQRQTVLFVEKDGYKVFSLTIDNNVVSSPLKLGLEESAPFDMQISTNIIHLGDDMFSNNSANSFDFKSSAKGYYYSKTFSRPKYAPNQDVVLKIGTIIGLDTKRAKLLGQNKIAQVYSSPAEVLVNGKRIAQIELNGDNIEILIPKNVLKETNELIIKTGKNLFQYDYVDYDDIELANIRIELSDKQQYARHR